METPRIEKVKRFIVKCWDDDIYILEGYKSEDEILAKFEGLEWVRMPNGVRVKTSAISKVQAYDDYRFQADQKKRHKIGQHLNIEGNAWEDIGGHVAGARLEEITGKMTALGAGKSPLPALPGKQ